MIDIKNNASALVYTAEKALKDAGAKIPEDIKKAIEEKISELNKAKEGDDSSLIKKATEDLSAEIQKIGEYMNQGNNASASGENIRDAEVDNDNQSSGEGDKK